MNFTSVGTELLRHGFHAGAQRTGNRCIQLQRQHLLQLPRRSRCTPQSAYIARGHTEHAFAELYEAATDKIMASLQGNNDMKSSYTGNSEHPTSSR